MALSEQRKAAFDYASDSTKQLITLATGIIAVSITFSTDVIGNTTAHRWALVAAWIVYVVSIVFGVWALLALTGTLELESGDETVAPSTAVQIIAFVTATGLLVVYAGLTLDAKTTPKPPATTVTVTTTG
jgi:hypothetical protein